MNIFLNLLNRIRGRKDPNNEFTDINPIYQNIDDYQQSTVGQSDTNINEEQNNDISIFEKLKGKIMRVFGYNRIDDKYADTSEQVKEYNGSSGGDQQYNDAASYVEQGGKIHLSEQTNQVGEHDAAHMENMKSTFDTLHEKANPALFNKQQSPYSDVSTEAGLANANGEEPIYEEIGSVVKNNDQQPPQQQEESIHNDTSTIDDVGEHTYAEVKRKIDNNTVDNNTVDNNTVNNRFTQFTQVDFDKPEHEYVPPVPPFNEDRATDDRATVYAEINHSATNALFEAKKDKDKWQRFNASASSQNTSSHTLG